MTINDIGGFSRIVAADRLELQQPRLHKPGSRQGSGGDAVAELEQLVWAQMLQHAGLDKVLTQSGGEAASAFSRYLLEAIAEDLAEQHPLGLSQQASGPSDSTSVSVASTKD